MSSGRLRPVALAYRRVMRAPVEPAAARAEISRRDQKRKAEALAAANRRVSTANPLGSPSRIAANPLPSLRAEFFGKLAPKIIIMTVGALALGASSAAPAAG